MASNGVAIHDVQGLRVLCIAESRGRLSHINELAVQHNAQAVIHAGNFGFFDGDSISRIEPKKLRHICMFSPLLDVSSLPREGDELKQKLDREGLSELPQFIRGEKTFVVPVYAIYGASEDLSVVEKFASGAYSVPNLHIIDENHTYALTTPSGQVIRLMGLGGTMVLHRFFDNGDGTSTIAGTHGLMWTTALQIGQLVQTVRKTFDQAEIRLFVSHPCPSREPLLLQLALALRADFTISSELHFFYGLSFNEFAAHPTFEQFSAKLAAARSQFMDIWDSVKTRIFALLDKDARQKLLLNSAVEVFEKMPTGSSAPGASHKPDYLRSAYKNLWHFNLSDGEYGTLVLNIVNGRVATEIHSKGFDFQYRAEPRAKSAKPEKRAAKALATSAGSTTSGATSKTEESANGSAEGDGSASGTPERETTPAEPEEPGIWIANGHVAEEEIRSYFTEEDRALIAKVVIREAYENPEKKFALVHFETEEQAKTALDRMDRDRCGAATMIRPHGPTGSRRGERFPRGSSRGAFRGSFRGARGSTRGSRGRGLIRD